MSSLNIKDLNNSINKRHLKRLELYNSILEKVHHRIKYNAELEKTFCFYSIPEFVIGTPLYNVNDLKNYLINSLTRDKFKLLYIDPNWLFISWEINKPEMKRINKIRKQSKQGGNYRLVDEYKPNGGFANEYDLQSMKEKSKYLI